MDMEGKTQFRDHTLRYSKWMKEEGMAGAIEFDLDDLPNKEFYTFRKTKVQNEHIFYRYHFLNLINKHYTRQTNSVYD